MDVNRIAILPNIGEVKETAPGLSFCPLGYGTNRESAFCSYPDMCRSKAILYDSLKGGMSDDH